jgi:DNA-binding NtrC family response regulator
MPHPNPPDKPLRMLIVDDDATILEVMWNIASQIEGLEIIKTENSLYALQLLQTETFHLLLTDLVMPDLNGLDLLKQAKALCPSLISAVVTGFGDLEMAIGAIKAGAFGYVHKPFRPEELALIIHNMQEKQHIMRRMEEQEIQIEELSSQIDECLMVETELRNEVLDLQEKLEAVGIPTEKNKGNILSAINKAATQKAHHNATSNFAGELRNLTHLLEEKKISEDEFLRFRQHVLKKAYGD